MNESLKRYVKHGTAFGPTDAGLIKVEDKAVLRELFDPQNKIYNALQLSPSIVIGRRGSGKTAYLHSVFMEREYKVIQEVRTSKTFSQIVSAIERNTTSYSPPEDIADLWEELFCLALMAELAARFKGESRELALIGDFVAKEDPSLAETFDSFLWRIVRTLSAKASGNLVGAVAEVVKEATGVQFSAAKRIALALLEKKQLRAIVLLDSLEQYPTQIQGVANALSGLLKCAGQFNERHERFHLRLCLPAELYHVFVDLVSSNPHKDLQPPNALTLHWISGELLNIAAHRLYLYVKLYFPHLVSVPPDLSSKERARAFLQSYLPVTVTNGLGYPEDSLAYILRHTQLQPRHLLIFLNAIFEKERKANGAYPTITEESVRSGIAETEHLLAEEVFSGYRMLYPTVRAICEACIPELAGTFTNAELQRVFTRRGKKTSGAADFWDFRRHLVETGIVGRVTDETERYFIGRFEYTEPHKLVIANDDVLCLHPVFAKVFHYKTPKGGAVKAVYPYGSDPSGADHRSWQFEP
jgi:hypothetical protein